MKTEILKPNDNNIELCASYLKEGQIVAFPTETVYGLGACITFDFAVKKIFEIKGRPCDNPLIVHLSDVSKINDLVKEIPILAYNLFDLMPGPLTLLFKKNASISNLVTGGKDTVGIRIPAHYVARDIISLCGTPVCAPSANTSTRPSPTTALHVFDDLNGKIRYILDGGKCIVGVESTIVDFSKESPRLLRKGGIGIEELKRRLGKIEIADTLNSAICPGMKYKHYSPIADVYFTLYDKDMQQKIMQKYEDIKAKSQKVLILCLSKNINYYHNKDIIDMGQTNEDYAKNLFAAFRDADKKGYNVILCEGISEDNVGAAVMNRIKKASGGKQI